MWPGTGWVIPRVKRSFLAAGKGAVLTTAQIAAEWTHPREGYGSRRRRMVRYTTVRRACERMGLVRLGRGDRYRDGMRWKMPDE
jgi:hypothetical protein